MTNSKVLKKSFRKYNIDLAIWSILFTFLFTFLFTANLHAQGGANLDATINGQNVGQVVEVYRTTVKHTWTQTGDKTWTRVQEGNPKEEQFQENRRDEWSVFLNNNQVQIDLWQKKVTNKSDESEGDIIEVALRKQVAAPTENWTTYEPSTTDYFQIISKDGTRLDIAGSETENGTNVLLYGKTNNPNQLFKFVPAEKNGYFLIETALKENRFLYYELTRYSKGHEWRNIKLGVGKGWGSKSFRLEKNATGDIRFVAKMNFEKFYLGLDDKKAGNLALRDINKVGDGNKILFKIERTVYTPPFLQWKSFKPSTTDYYQIVAKSGSRLDVAGSETGNGTNVLLYGKSNNPNQLFKFVPTKNGHYKLETALKKGMFLSLEKSNLLERNIQLGKAESEGQEYRLEKNPDGYIRFLSALGENRNLYISEDDKKEGNIGLVYRDLGDKILFKLEPTFYVAKFTESDLNKRTILGTQTVSSSTPPAFKLTGTKQAYEGIKSKREIDINGLGRCYDIRRIDPLQWTKETLSSQQSAKVFDFFRNNAARQFDFNSKQYAVPHGVAVVNDSRGKGEVSYKHVITANEFENEVLQEYRLGVGIPKVASAKASIGFKNTTGGSSKNTSMFTFTKQLATYYKTDVQLDHPTYKHKLDEVFYNSVRRLGHSMSANEFINKFGTHFASSTAYGGNFLQRTTISQEEYAHYAKEEREFKLDVEATIKKINISAGTTQGSSNSNSNSQDVKTVDMELMTVGGDTNIKNPEEWARTVIKNPTVVEVRLASLATLLNRKYFPTIPNIDSKRKLLQVAINQKIKEAKTQMSQGGRHSFFTKSPINFEFKVTSIQCVNKDDDGKGDFFGVLNMGFYGKNGDLLYKSKFMNLSNDDHDFEMNKGHISVEDATGGYTGIFSKTITPGRDMEDGYVQIWGWMKEDDAPDVDMGKIVSGQKNSGAISYQEAMKIGRPVTRNYNFQNGNDHIRIHYQLLRKN